MLWFKVILCVFLGLAVVLQLAAACGWRPEQPSGGEHAVGAVLTTLLCVGVAYWL